MKIRRHSKIIELVKSNDIETQEELAVMLRNEGFDVTQATVSRDIRELKLSKISLEDGRQKYTLYTSNTGSSQLNDKLLKVFREGVLNIEYAQNLIILKTMIGMAMAIAACIDSMEYPEILGCIAGDDTIFCAVKTESDAQVVLNRFRDIMKLN